MGWIERESLSLVCPDTANELAGREAAKDKKQLGAVASVNEVSEMGPKLGIYRREAIVDVGVLYR
jgi:hypothetical protein